MYAGLNSFDLIWSRISTRRQSLEVFREEEVCWRMRRHCVCGVKSRWEIKCLWCAIEEKVWMRWEWLFLSVNAVRLYALHAALHTQNASLLFSWCVKGRKNCVQFFVQYVVCRAFLSNYFFIFRDSVKSCCMRIHDYDCTKRTAYIRVLGFNQLCSASAN